MTLDLEKPSVVRKITHLFQDNNRNFSQWKLLFGKKPLTLEPQGIYFHQYIRKKNGKSTQLVKSAISKILIYVKKKQNYIEEGTK